MIPTGTMKGTQELEKKKKKVNVICYLVFTITLNYSPGNGVKTRKASGTWAITSNHRII